MRALLPLLCCVAAPLAAQLPAADCVDRAGQPVLGVIREDMPWAGAATELNGESVIYWNQSRNAHASQVLRLFIYMHECAHHTLGHIWKALAPQWELEADCWAVQTLRERGVLPGPRLRQLEREVRRSRSRRGRFAGARRGLNDCITIKTDRDAWRRSLDAFAAASTDSFTSIMGQAVPRPSARTGIHESALDLPGTYDCEVVASRDLRCALFRGRNDGAVSRRFRAITGIVRGWMPAGWTAEESSPGAGVARRLDVSDSVGRRLTVSSTDDRRVVFVMHPMPRSRDAVLPPERIAFRLTVLEPPCPTQPHDGGQMRFVPYLMLLGAGGFAIGCGDAPPPADPAADPAAAAAAAPANLRDPVQLSVDAEIGGRHYRTSGLGECQHTPQASIYSVPAAMWRTSYSADGAGDLRHFNMTLWQPDAGGAMQANLSVQVGDRTHRLATVAGGEIVGSGSASARMDGAAGTLGVSGQDGEGTAITISVQCERLTVPVAEGG